MAKTTEQQTIDVTKIQDDVKSLQQHMVELRKDMGSVGRARAEELKNRAKDNVAYMQGYSRDQLKHVEDNIKDNPARSVMIAFGAGLLTSMLFSSSK